jgi:TIR domain/Pentapeptide repeats (8 copies)
MANVDQLGTLLLGVIAWNEWRARAPDEQPDLGDIALPEADLVQVNLAGANLRGADLHGADLSSAALGGADLGEANLRGAILHGADLTWSYLNAADLRGADLGEALLGEANLGNASFAKADLRGADLHGADLRGADLSGAAIAGANFAETILADTRFGNVDLSAAKGLTNINHAAASTIGVDTILRSKGDIPEVFLRGAGVPESFIGFINSRVLLADQTHSYLICHNPKDKRFCDRLNLDLQGHGLKTWYFPEDAPRGQRIFAEIVSRVKMFDRVIVVCSRNSLQSRPVVNEIAEALRREQQEHMELLFPVRLDNYMLKEWEHPHKATVVARVAADFRGWNRITGKYEEAFKNLLAAVGSRLN